MTATPKRMWRDLKCTTCNQINGFTRADLKMHPNYVMQFWCHTCDDYTINEFVGAFFAVNGKMERTELVFEFEFGGDQS